MANFIEEFYYGNLDPQARSTKENKTVQKQMEVLMLNEDFLTEQLKAENQLEWVRCMNNIRQRANEIIYKDLIYV